MTPAMSLAQKAKRESARGQARLRLEAEATRKKAEQEGAKLEQREREYADDRFKEELAKIKAASRNGEHSIRVKIMQWSEEATPRWAELRADFLTKLFEQEGFKVELETGRMDPFGSDPMFDRTVYDIDLKVSW